MAEETVLINGADPKIRWKNRRRMAWTSVVGMLIVTALLFFAPIDNERLKIIAEPITWYYFCSSAVIGAYMGFTTVEKFKMGK
jgi:hypothetical protein